MLFFADGPVESSCTHCEFEKKKKNDLSLVADFPRLVGFPPFWHRKQLVMLRSIMEGKYEFVSPEWDDISDSAKDMVCGQ